MIQAIIFIFSASAIWLVGRKESYRIWGYVFGLAGQPFWLYSTTVNHQWVIFCLCLWYTYSWGSGLYNHIPAEKGKKWNGLIYIFRSTYQFLVWKIWYYRILGRRRAIQKEEDCSLYIDKKTTTQKFMNDCQGDGHYMCKGCVHHEIQEGQ